MIYRLMFFVSLAVGTHINLFCQSEYTKYYDSDWTEINDSVNYFFKEFVALDSIDHSKGNIKTYLNNGQILNDVSYNDIENLLVYNGKRREWYLDGKLKMDIDYQNGWVAADGEVKIYWPNGNLKRHDIHRDGHVIQKKCYDSTGKEVEYFNFREPPKFVGGENALWSFIMRHFRYPPNALKNQIQGVVMVSFIVTEKGDIINPKIVKSIGGDCSEEALRVLKLMPRWEPSLEDGVPVNEYFTMPFTFKLE